MISALIFMTHLQGSEHEWRYSFELKNITHNDISFKTMEREEESNNFGACSLAVYFDIINKDDNTRLPYLLVAGSAQYYQPGLLITVKHNLIQNINELYRMHCCVIHVCDHKGVLFEVSCYINSMTDDIALVMLKGYPLMERIWTMAPNYYLEMNDGIDESVEADLRGYTTKKINNNTLRRFFHFIKAGCFVKEGNSLTLKNNATFFGMSGANILTLSLRLLGVHRLGNCNEPYSLVHLLHTILGSQKAEALYIDPHLQKELKLWHQLLYKNQLSKQFSMPRLRSADDLVKWRPVLFVIQSDLDKDLQLHFLSKLDNKLRDRNESSLKDLCDYFILSGQIDAIKNMIFPEPLFQTDNKFSCYPSGQYNDDVMFSDPNSMDYTLEGVKKYKNALLIILGICTNTEYNLRIIYEINYLDESYICHCIYYLDIEQHESESALIEKILLNNRKLKSF